jgi:hypothetical protein
VLECCQFSWRPPDDLLSSSSSSSLLPASTRSSSSCSTTRSGSSDLYGSSLPPSSGRRRMHQRTAAADGSSDDDGGGLSLELRRAAGGGAARPPNGMGPKTGVRSGGEDCSLAGTGLQKGDGGIMYALLKYVGYTLQRANTEKIGNKYSQKRNCAATQSQFPHSCVHERLIYYHDRSAYFAAGNMWTDPGNIPYV